jgi:exodeoxyribonuclease V alpha subunit
MPDLERAGPESDFHFVPAEDPETAVERIVELVRTRIPRRYGFDPIRDVQVLCPMQRGGVGARALNIELQAALNPAGEQKVERFGWTFAPGDKVMQLDNDYETLPTASGSSTRWRPPTPSRSTRARAASTRPW